MDVIVAETPRTGSETILVAEDDAAVRALASDMLREHAYTVLTAGDGEEALRVPSATRRASTCC
jgi:CheY-like chemotaxis protein